MPSWESNRVVPGGTGRSDSVISSSSPARDSSVASAGCTWWSTSAIAPTAASSPAGGPSSPIQACRAYHAPAASPALAVPPAAARTGAGRSPPRWPTRYSSTATASEATVMPATHQNQVP